MLFSSEGLLNSDKRQQIIAKNNLYMFALFEIARIYHGPKSVIKIPKIKG